MWNMIKQSFPSLTWFLLFLGPPTAITLLLIFGPCLLNCLVNFVSKWLEATKLQMILIQENKQLRLWSGGNQTYFRWVREEFWSSNLGENYAHVQQEAALEDRTSSFSVPREWGADYTTQSNLQIQCNPYQITNGIFYGTRTNHLKICMETQKTPNSQSSLEGKKRSWRNQTPWLQTILQSYSNQDNMVLAQKQKHRSIE